MSRKHRRNPELDARLETERLQEEVSREIERWQEAEKLRQAEWSTVEHLPIEVAVAYFNNSGRRRVRNRPEMAKCHVAGCDKPAINLMGKLLGICVWHGLDVVTYFDVTDAEHQARDDRKTQLLAQRRYIRMQKVERELRAAESRKQQPGWVYYLLVAERIKIGFTKDVKRRLRSYPPDSPLLALHPGTKQTEQEMHAKFAGSKAAGREWFLDTPDLRDHIKTVIDEFGEPDRARYEHRGQHRDMRGFKAS